MCLGAIWGRQLAGMAWERGGGGSGSGSHDSTRVHHQRQGSCVLSTHMSVTAAGFSAGHFFSTSLQDVCTNLPPPLRCYRSALQGLLRKLGANFDDMLPMGVSGARMKVGGCMLDQKGCCCTHLAALECTCIWRCWLVQPHQPSLLDLTVCLPRQHKPKACVLTSPSSPAPGLVVTPTPADHHGWTQAG